jgi:hypothetical protein
VGLAWVATKAISPPQNHASDLTEAGLASEGSVPNQAASQARMLQRHVYGSTAGGTLPAVIHSRHHNAMISRLFGIQSGFGENRSPTK